MTETDSLSAVILETLKSVAPEATLEDLDKHRSFRDQIEIDSVDFLNFVLRLEEKLAIHIPEVDFPMLSSLEGCVRYLGTRVPERPSA